ncbi:MAG: lytic transglycosylase domain-containing protein [Arachidicoccus sp.]|nr:lytic transglycosylase domain-containing protein [Arachidicoccus sp.]
MKHVLFKVLQKRNPVLHILLFGSLAISVMSFTYKPVAPGKDKKTEKKTNAKSGPKEFATLLPTTQPVTLDPKTESVDENIGKSTKYSSEVKVALNPKVKDFADDYINHESTDLTRMKTWAKPIFKLMDGILSDYELPTQLKYLAVIESSLKRNTRMSSGATGPWQLMHDEGIRYGLIKNGHDYRTDYAKSTEAAAKLLTSLYNNYHDWLLTIAAYNAGIGRVNKAIDQAGSDDFWKVQYYLPTETRNHVKKFISTHYFFEGTGGTTTMSAKETKNYKDNIRDNSSNTTDNDDASEVELTNDNNIVRIRGYYNEDAICKALNMNKAAFEKQNPDFNKKIASGKFYDLHLEDYKIKEFVSKKDDILQQSFNQLLGDSGKATDDISSSRTSIDR